MIRHLQHQTFLQHALKDENEHKIHHQEMLHDLEVFQLKGSNPVAPIAMIVVGATFFMVIAIFLLLRADRRKSERLRVDMVRRRRKREGREAGAV